MTSETPAPEPTENGSPATNPEGNRAPVSPNESTGAPGPYNPPAGPPAAALNPQEDKQWASFSHFGGVFGFLPALVIYVVFKDRGRFTRQESQEALNFQITVAAAVVVCLVLGLIPLIGILFSLVLLGLWIAMIVFSVLAGISANKGVAYRYPVAVRLIK